MSGVRFLPHIRGGDSGEDIPDRGRLRISRHRAGVIHSDFERGFIAAETVSYEDFQALGGETGAREAGKMRAEGRDYVVRPGLR